MKASVNHPFYHVRHDLQPKLTEELLILLWDKNPCNVEILKLAAKERGYLLAKRSPDQLLASLGNLRMITHREHSEICLSELGRITSKMAKYNPRLLPDLIHFTYYTTYDEDNPSTRFSWAYRLICDFLWEAGSSLINVHELVTLVQEHAQQIFPDYREYGASFSQNSVAGIINWLEAMGPPCISQTSSINRTMTRRAFCSVELVLLALEYARATLGNTLVSQLQLTEEVRQSIARICLVEEEALDNLFQITSEAFELIFRQTERGYWISLLGDRSPLPLKVWLSHASTV